MKAAFLLVAMFGSGKVVASASSSAPAVAMGDMVSMLLSLFAVVILIVAMAMLMKRLNPNLGNSENFKVIRSMPLGNRERLLVVEIDNKQHLLGVTANSINYLYQLEQPLPEHAMPPLAQNFSKLLQRAHNKNE